MPVWDRLSPPMRGATILVLIGVLLLAAVWGVKNAPESSDTAEIKTVSAGVIKDEDGLTVDSTETYTTSFIVPGGAIGIELDIGTTAGAYPEIHPPAGGVLVSANLTRLDDAPIAAPGAAAAGGQRGAPSRIWLRSGEFRAPLFSHAVPDTAEEEGRDIAVPKTDQPLVLELDLGGKRQTVDVRSGQRTTGAFSALYRPREHNTADSGAEGQYAADSSAQRSGDLRWYAGANATYRRVPYVDDLGWAKKGREWLVLDETELQVDDIVDPQTDGKEPPFDTIRTTRTKSSKGGVTAAGARVARAPSTELSPYTSPYETDGSEKDDPEVAYYSTTNVVFDVPAGSATRLTFSLRIRLKPPRKTTLRATKHLVIPAAPRVMGETR